MNKLKLTIGLLLITNLTLSGQTFTEDYFKFFSIQWEKGITDSMRNTLDPKIDSLYIATTGKGFWEVQQESALKSTKERVARFEYIVEALGISEEMEIFIIEEKQINPVDPNFSNQINGMIKSSSETFYYSSGEFFRMYERSEFSPFDPIIFEYFELLSNNNFDVIRDLASKEVDPFDPMKRKNLEYELISYNRSRDKTIKVAYLHEKK